MLSNTYGEKEFSDEIISRWGDLSEDLQEDAELLHVQMAHLGRLCNAHPEISTQVFEFLDQTVSRLEAISEIENAVAISFLEWPELEGFGKEVTIPVSIKKIVKEQWERGGNF